jgi:hypothetical protein
MACYVWQGIGTDGGNYAFALCTTGTPGWVVASAYPSGNYKAPGVNGALAPGADNFFTTPGPILSPTNQSAYDAAIAGRGVRGNCTSCLGIQPEFDCINGACISKSTYNTPGIYNSLEECEAACGTGCGGKCISNSDWAQIEGLADKLKQKNCS